MCEDALVHIDGLINLFLADGTSYVFGLILNMW